MWWLIVAQLAMVDPTLPRPDLTPGAVVATVTQKNIAHTICDPNWHTRQVRPSTAYTNSLKRSQIVQYGYVVANPLPLVTERTARGAFVHPDLNACVVGSSNPECYEEDHLVSLELGGEPRSPKNLWPQPWFGEWNAHAKDVLENSLHRQVCDGTVPLREAQQAIAEDWIAAFQRYVTTR